MNISKYWNRIGTVWCIIWGTQSVLTTENPLTQIGLAFFYSILGGLMWGWSDNE